MLRSQILPHPPLVLSPGSPLLPFPVQLNTEPWIGWSQCLGRADIFETLLPIDELREEDYVSFLCCRRHNKLISHNFYSFLFSTQMMDSMNMYQGPAAFYAHIIYIFFYMFYHVSFGIESSFS